MATFNGTDLGECTCAYVPNPGDWQYNAYPGVSGRQRIFMGSRGGKIIVDGMIYGANLASLTSIFTTFYGHQSGGTVADLVDNEAVTYPLCALIEFTPQERIERAADGAYVRAYRMVFEHP